MQEIKVTVFDAGYDRGNLEQDAVLPGEPELQPAYELGYELGVKHRQERHALRATIRKDSH